MRLHLNHIQKSFDKHSILRDVSFVFEDSIIYGILGRNGAGKTTLFNIIYREIEADGGDFWIEDSTGNRPIELKDVAMVFAENYLPEFLTGFEFIRFFIDIRGHDDALSVDEYLDLVGINESDRHRLIKEYSSGMQSKLSLLTVFIAQPPIILLDEPLTAVDVVSGIEIKKLLMTLKPGRIILLSTHIPQLAEDLCDQIILLRQGELAALDEFDRGELFEAQIIKALSEDVDHE